MVEFLHSESHCARQVKGRRSKERRLGEERRGGGDGAGLGKKERGCTNADEQILLCLEDWSIKWKHIKVSCACVRKCNLLLSRSE